MALLEFYDIDLETNSTTPLYQQVYLQFKQHILSGRFPANTALPPSRVLANNLQVSRNTVINAYDQLRAEGYLESKPGSGISVAKQLPDQFTHPQKTMPNDSQAKPMPKIQMAKRAQSLNKPSTKAGNRLFQPGIPNLEQFPHKVWSRLCHLHGKFPKKDLMAIPDSQGLLALRTALAKYLQESRGVQCTQEQIIITQGAQQGLSLISHLMLNPGDKVAIEEPGYIRAKDVFNALGANCIACPIDANGLNFEKLKSSKSNLKLIYTTPTHQYPLGYIMPVAQRLQLLDWAMEKQAFIIEDDYDSEYHYESRPISALQGLAHYQNVFYLSSFSKVLFPSLRLGYLVIPESLVEVCCQLKEILFGSDNSMMQAVTADFIEQGHLNRHIKRMRTLYHANLQALTKAVNRELADIAHLHSPTSGMHAVLLFKHQTNDQQFVTKLRQHDIYATALSSYYINQPKQQGLVLGFANASTAQIDKAIKTIEHFANSLKIANN